jgi:thioredoxin reductase (NADPH)
VLVVVDEDPAVLRQVEAELRDRYARHYRIVCLRSPAEALHGLFAADSGERRGAG